MQSVRGTFKSCASVCVISFISFVCCPVLLISLKLECKFPACVKSCCRMSTKSLAKKLGLIRQRSQSCSETRQQQSVCKQHFRFLIIIDFESTCWREKNNYGQEIIEFPAVLLNVSNGKVESEFHSYVQPQEHPVLSEFCTELTGITQDQVELAPPLHICLSRFIRWLHSLQQEKGVVFESDSKGPAPSGQPCAFVTWSDWDLGVCLLYECKRKQICVPEALKSWIDLRATYRLFYNRKPKGLRGALMDLGIQFTGREHSGLVDARNTAMLAWRMVCDGCVLTVTKSLRRTVVKPRPLRGNISERSTRPASVAEDKQPQTLISPHTVLNTNKPVCVSIPQTHFLLTTKMTDTTYDPDTLDTCWRDGVILTEEEEPSSYDDVPLGDEPSCYDNITLGEEPSSYDDVALEEEPSSHYVVPLGAEPDAVGPSVSDSSSDDSDRLLRTRNSESCKKPLIQSHSTTEPNKTTSNLHKPHPSRPASLFKTPKLPHTDLYGPVSRLLGRSAAPFSVYSDPTADPPVSTRTPSVSRPPLSCAVNHSSAANKRTSPLCACGRRARRLTVGNGGPNHGRVFYSCPVRRQGCDGRHKGCEFFQWESGFIQTRTQNHLRTPKTSSCRTRTLR
ncbi:ERI1 exoribonuclease 2 isoform X2 [Myxocyprinus asiaticus]|uniref:ERI1 exoribonuclease 2 isoform X2 n=1 Tax=Myxocyprinus asiaticus TaxID=70543 RepID=UPI002222A823|nr:ERI1 exoribonuclease 2 isoform X2 [Myxocyprinus asiaticus]